MTAALLVLAAVVWVLSGFVLLLSVRLHRAHRRPVVGLRRQESTDKLPVSLALYGAWTHPGHNTPEEFEAVKARVRDLHPDLAAALDRCVDAYVTRANLAARRPDPATGVPAQRLPARAQLEACGRGEHRWRVLEGMAGVRACASCDAIEGVA